MRLILTHFSANIQELYKPGRHISVDKGMIGFKGRLSFRQYMPAKPTKYGIKVWMAADASNGFVINHEVYLGKQPGCVLANGLGYSVVMELMSPSLNKNHHVYFDNFFLPQNYCKIFRMKELTLAPQFVQVVSGYCHLRVES